VKGKSPPDKSPPPSQIKKRPPLNRDPPFSTFTTPSFLDFPTVMVICPPLAGFFFSVFVCRGPLPLRFKPSCNVLLGFGRMSSLREDFTPGTQWSLSGCPSRTASLSSHNQLFCFRQSQEARQTPFLPWCWPPVDLLLFLDFPPPFIFLQVSLLRYFAGCLYWTRRLLIFTLPTPPHTLLRLFALLLCVAFFGTPLSLNPLAGFAEPFFETLVCCQFPQAFGSPFLTPSPSLFLFS